MRKWSKIGVAVALGLMMSLMFFSSDSFAQSTTADYGIGQTSTHAALATNAPQGAQQLAQQAGLTRPHANASNTARSWSNAFRRCRRVFTWRRFWWRGGWRWRRGWVTVCRRW